MFIRSLLYFNIQEKLNVPCSRAEDLILDIKQTNKTKAFKKSRKSLKLFFEIYEYKHFFPRKDAIDSSYEIFSRVPDPKDLRNNDQKIN